MSPSPRISLGDNINTYFMTFTIVEWIDIFTQPIYFDIISNSLKFCIKNKGLKLYEYVIMTNHMHLIATADSKDGLDGVVRDFKSFTHHEIKKALQEEENSMLLHLRIGSMVQHGKRFWNYQVIIQT